jgi:hypothetical protein
MGQQQSNLSSEVDDLNDSNDLAMDKKAILITLKPVYIINDTSTNGEIIDNLDTGNELLNQKIEQKLCNVTTTIKQLLSELKFNVLACIQQNTIFHITIEKIDQSIFDLNDCKFIRQSINEYNQYNKAITIITEEEACISLFYEDLGPIKLGFMVGHIEFI